MSIYKKGQDRNQQLLFPPSLDELVDENNSVRAIDSYVDILDINKLGFINTRKSNSNDGQKAYSPKLLLKIYIYGYLNKIRSSRMLEREIKRNIELMWLTSGLTPTYRTISQFRADNYEALKQVFKEFVLLCKNINLIGNGLKALDGAFLRANASKNKLILKSAIKKDLVKIDEDITKYLTSLEYADKEKQPSNIVNKLPKDLRQLKYHKEQLNKDLQLLDKLDKTQLNTTDKDASLMVKPSHNLMAYNSQAVIDDKYKFIVATDITSQGNDLKELHKMAIQTKKNLKLSCDDKLEIVADTGYYSAKELKKCKEDNINAYVPQPNSTKAQQDKNKYTRDKFIYDENDDCYICPNNTKLLKTPKPQIKNGKINYIYRSPSANCNNCPLRDKCITTKTKYKQIYRWEFEDIVEQHKIKMQTKIAKDIVKKRGSLVEHPFGTIKRTLGWDHFLVRGKDKVSGENALIMFTYNFKRLLNLIGITLFNKLILAIKNKDLTKIKEEIARYILLSYLFFTYYIQIIFMIQYKSLKIRNTRKIA